MEEQNISPKEVLDIMLHHDNFSKWLGLEIDEHRIGFCKLHFRITDVMLNGFRNIHGGVLFSASDSAFAFACNSHGTLTVALDASINFMRQVMAGEILTVEAEEVYLGNKTGVYEIRTTNEKNELVCTFKGTAYRTSKQVK
ncbi:MAG: hotdog fold thioesterase [Bacteroidetes bacterium]|nr:hotdog fold thioesterase [Bacteroidota bacterium]